MELYRKFLLSFYLFASLLFNSKVEAQRKKSKRVENPVFVDKQGVLRWTKTKAEAAFFGVNYTVPFAYGYRSHKALNADLEKAIDQDVYHMARLGLDAFRVHVWDTEISDSIGNLKDNEHLRLFDYLISKLKERNIKILITPIAFWGNGYPERDEQTGSFVGKYGKGPSVVNEDAIRAQERYVQQFFEHVNPYTKLTYGNDPDVVAVEINNEPHHSGPKERTTEYINRLTKSIRSTGWTKPVFYNISESPAYADAVAKSNVDGFSFQWYPTGLVANHTLQGNYLPNVDQYKIPFDDTIPQFAGKSRMVYEFDAGDVLQSNMYPVMARSFRAAGFQWATQFAYDPMATAYGNTEYQTHYLNLAYTPSKAISLMIASKAFHLLPRLENYSTYPRDSVFGQFRVSYKEDLSEMNSQQEFYHSNSTGTKPLETNKLQHIAGVGSSPVVEYPGYGAYFLDKQQDGSWRLEVMPDAIFVRDPFEKASPKKTVTGIQWHSLPMKISLPGLGADFSIEALNTGNTYSTTAVNNNFLIQPGTYLLKQKGQPVVTTTLTKTIIDLPEFVAPPVSAADLLVIHTPLAEVSADRSFTIAAKIIGLEATDKISVELRNSEGKWKTIDLQKRTPYDCSVDVPADMVTSGLLNYRFIIKKADGFHTFPGNYKGDPYAWDNTNNDTWQTFVAASNTPLQLFNALTDRTALSLYNPDWRNYTISYVAGDKPGQLNMKTTVAKPGAGQQTGWQLYVADKLRARQTELSLFNKIVIRANTTSSEPVIMKVSLISSAGAAFSATIKPGNEMKDIEIPLSSLVVDSSLLLPRPYPGFLPLKFKAAASQPFNIGDVDKIEVMFMHDANLSKAYSTEIESVFLKK
jgi:hypothetical protein